MWLLTEIDKKILNSLRAGKTPDEVAESLKMNRNTVYSHLSKMRRKYRECKQFINAIDELKKDPKIAPYLKTGT